MHRDQKTQVDKSKSKEARLVAKRALLQLLEPIAGFVLDSGLSAAEFRTIFHQAIVESAVLKQMQVAVRVNISGIAAVTGISRAEVSRLVNARRNFADNHDDGHSQSTNRILSAWHEDPKFAAPDGHPAELPLFGRGTSFESLTKKYGLGLPVRAVLDELIRFGAVELLPDQRIRSNTPTTIERGVSARVVRAFGERGSELLATMLGNMRSLDEQKFIASASEPAVLLTALPLFRQELSLKGADFLAELQASLRQKSAKRSSSAGKQETTAVSVTIFYHESACKTKQTQVKSPARKNFRRGRQF